MFCKFSVTYFLLISLASCERSFTIVLDTTVSMEEELDLIKSNLGTVLNIVSNNTEIFDYIIVPFNDEVQQPLISRMPRDLLYWLNGVTVSGGNECPEKSLAGIERALQISKTQSYIFVFTDAFSKDASRLGAIQNLCKTTKSKVVIFLSGFCLPSRTSPVGNINVYYDIAAACSGTVVRIELTHLTQAFKFIEVVTEMEWTNVQHYFTDQEYTFSVDLFTKNVVLAISGETAVVEIIKANTQGERIEKIVDSRRTQILRLTEPAPGVKKVRCRGPTHLTLYVKQKLPAEYGFSTKEPRSLRETALRPIPGTTNYLLIKITEPSLKLETLEIEIENESKRNSFDLEEKGDELYLAKIIVEPEKSFRIWVKCYDTLNHNELSGAFNYILPQKNETYARETKPVLEMLEDEQITVQYGTSKVVACKIHGYPKPNIFWEDSTGRTLISEEVLLEMPSVYISYVTIESVTKNCTIYCKSKNAKGEDEKALDVFVYRPYIFEIIQKPTDITIEYGSKGKLFCNVNAYPEAEMKWYHNDSLLSETNDIGVEIIDNALIINNMTPDNVGDYKCVITNEIRNATFISQVDISGIEAPEIELENSEIVLKLGEWSYLECRVIKGNPKPSITWQYKSEDDFDYGDIPDGVVTDKGKLKIASVQMNHKGVYRCEAANLKGTDSGEISVKLQYAPIIVNSSESPVVVREGDSVALICEVHAEPVPNTRWLFSRGGILEHPDAQHVTDAGNTHRLFNALWRDSGEYHCIAENEVGKAEKTITVKVLVAPYIEPPKSQIVILRIGESTVLDCNISYGDPVPTTKWVFTALDSTTTLLSSGKSSLPLYLENVSRANGGSYLCIAENEVTTDRIQISVKVQ